MRSQADEAGARATAAQLDEAGFTSGVLHSDDYSSLNPGFWVAYVGPYPESGGDHRRRRAGVGRVSRGLPAVHRHGCRVRLADPPRSGRAEGERSRRATIRGCHTPPLRFAPPSTPTSRSAATSTRGPPPGPTSGRSSPRTPCTSTRRGGASRASTPIPAFFVESMRGLEDWRFPIRFTAVEGDEVVTVWDQVLPGVRPDGGRYRQTGVSLLQYAGRRAVLLRGGRAQHDARAGGPRREWLAARPRLREPALRPEPRRVAPL